MTAPAPLDPAVAAAAAAARAALDEPDREALRARLVAAQGNVTHAADALAAETGKTRRAAHRAMLRAIGRLGLRSWLTETYPVPGSREP